MMVGFSKKSLKNLNQEKTKSLLVYNISYIIFDLKTIIQL